MNYTYKEIITLEQIKTLAIDLSLLRIKAIDLGFTDTDFDCVVKLFKNELLNLKLNDIAKNTFGIGGLYE